MTSRAEVLEPGLRRLVAPNPSPMTAAGTNTYILGSGAVAVVDPGPGSPAHLDAILGSLGPGETVTDILVTHSHSDHSALAPALAARTGAVVHAFGDSRAGQSQHLQGLSGIGGGEGVDRNFRPDRRLEDGAVVLGGDWRIRAYWTPGHFGNHMSFVWRDTIFTGDTAMGWASSVVSPPDGDLTAFMRSLAVLRDLGARRLYPGHGPAVEAPRRRIDWLLNHRRMRERQILAALADGPMAAAALTARIYADIPPDMHPAARRNVIAHLIDLETRNAVAAQGPLAEETVFALR